MNRADINMSRSMQSVKFMRDKDEQEYTIQLTEMRLNKNSVIYKQPLRDCDIVCFVFDSSVRDSFDTLHDLHK